MAAGPKNAGPDPMLCQSGFFECDYEAQTMKFKTVYIPMPDGTTFLQIWARLFPALPAVKGGIDAFNVFRFHWAGGGRASFAVKESRIIVDEIYRGTVVRAGAAGAMLAKAIQQAGASKPLELYVSNVLQKTSQSTAVLSRVMQDAAKGLGGKVQSVSQGVDAGKTWVLVKVGY